MPSPQAILAGLTAIAHDALPLAVVWHVLFAALLVALSRGFRPTNRNAALLLVTPILSVALLAALYGNPFNAVVFGAGAATLLLTARRVSRRTARRAPAPLALTGAALFAFGWVYPHFLEGFSSPLIYLMAAPTGLVPCPTLSAVIGLALVADGLRSRAWSTVLSLLGLFYGLFGALRLGVTIDLVLTAGAAVLLGVAWLRARAAEPREAIS